MPELEEFHRSIKYRVYPTEEQKGILGQTFGCIRKVFNMGLEMQNGLFQAGMRPLKKNRTQ